MRNLLVVFLIVFTLYSCKNSKEKYAVTTKIDFNFKTYNEYNFDNPIFRHFVSEYIKLPENEKKKVFTLYLDERADTLLFTIWRYPYRKFSLNKSLGYFYYIDRVVIVYSPFIKVMSSQIDSSSMNIISNLYDQELKYYSNHKHKLVMWQLQIPYHEDSPFIEKDFKRIINTVKPPLPDNMKDKVIDIQYEAD